MTIQYQNTPDEYLEASEAMAVRRGKKNIALRLFFAGAFAIYGTICVFIAATTTGANSSALNFNLWFPFGFCAIVFFVVAFIKLFTSNVPGARWRAGFSLLFVGLMVAGLYEMVISSHQVNPTSGSPWEWNWFAPHASWLFLTITMLVATIINQRALRKNMWAGQATLHRAKTAEISAECLCITDSASRLEYRWQAFAGWQETKTLIVIYLSAYQIVFIPKSAFDSTEKLDAMRALAGLIPTSTSSAFQVVQTSLPPALPAEHHA